MPTLLLRMVFDYDGKRQVSHEKAIRLNQWIVLAVDVSLKTPVLNALTERTAIDATWEQCMIVAPVTIQLMGQLLIVASTKDVSFRAFAPDRKFTYIWNPESFRATLLQVSHGKP